LVAFRVKTPGLCVHRMTAYHAQYFAHKLTKRCSSDSGGKLAASLADAQVDLNPHQIDATPRCPIALSRPGGDAPFPLISSRFFTIFTA
jgi:hypothetical protein